MAQPNPHVPGRIVGWAWRLAPRVDACDVQTCMFHTRDTDWPIAAPRFSSRATRKPLPPLPMWTDQTDVPFHEPCQKCAFCRSLAPKSEAYLWKRHIPPAFAPPGKFTYYSCKEEIGSPSRGSCNSTSFCRSTSENVCVTECTKAAAASSSYRLDNSSGTTLVDPGT